MEIDKIQFGQLSDAGKVNKSFEDLDVNNDGKINKEDENLATNLEIKNVIFQILASDVDEEPELVLEKTKADTKASSGTSSLDKIEKADITKQITSKLVNGDIEEGKTITFDVCLPKLTAFCDGNPSFKIGDAAYSTMAESNKEMTKKMSITKRNGTYVYTFCIGKDMVSGKEYKISLTQEDMENIFSSNPFVLHDSTLLKDDTGKRLGHDNGIFSANYEKDTCCGMGEYSIYNSLGEKQILFASSNQATAHDYLETAYLRAALDIYKLFNETIKNADKNPSTQSSTNTSNNQNSNVNEIVKNSNKTTVEDVAKSSEEIKASSTVDGINKQPKTATKKTENEDISAQLKEEIINIEKEIALIDIQIKNETEDKQSEILTSRKNILEYNLFNKKIKLINSE